VKLRLYGLLHLDDKQQSGMNLRTKDFAEQVSIYVRNAINLSNTLRSQGVSFTLLTNRLNVVCEVVQSEESSLEVKEIPFVTQVPSGVRFYSSHFKLDAFRYLSSEEHDYVGLCDLDMVCVNAYPACLHNIARARIPLYYDISDQVIPAYGHEVIIKDLKSIHGIDSEGRWCGGEFIAGTPDFFGKLVEEIEGVYTNYIRGISAFHHVGDEAITTAALEVLRRKGLCIGEAGTLGIVGRYWNTDTLHPQRPFSYFERCFLLHLPADKRFLADLARGKVNTSSDFFRLYAAHRRLSFVRKLNRRIHRLSFLMKLKRRIRRSKSVSPSQGSRP
jgi:hypothetical protein